MNLDMNSESICKICMSHSARSSVGGIDYCQDCGNKYHYLISGIEAHTSPSYRLSQKKIDAITGLTPYDDRFLIPINWYNIPSLHDTAHLTISTSSSSTENIIRDLKDVVSRVGIKNALTYLCSVRLLSDFGADDSFTDKDVGIPPRMMEYAIALVGSFSFEGSQIKRDSNKYHERLCIINNLSNKDLDGGYYDIHHRTYGSEVLDIYTKLETLYSEFNAKYSEFGERPFRDDDSLAAAARNSELVYGNYAYPEQYIEAMERRYAPYQFGFLDSHGLDMVKSVGWASELLDECDHRLRDVYQEARFYQFDCLRLIGGIQEAIQEGDRLIDYLMSPRHTALQRGELASWAMFMTTAENRFWISEKEIKNKFGLYNQDRISAFLDRISISAGDYQVMTPFGYNQLEATPLIELDGEYLLAHPPMFTRALSKTFFYNLGDMNDPNDTKVALDIDDQGYLLEQWVYDRISQLFIDGGGDVLANVNWGPGEPEIDVIAKLDSVALIIEAKSKFLTDKARKGSVEDIKEDLNRGVLKAVGQLDTNIELLKSGGLSFSEAMDSVPFNNSDIDEYIPIVVMGGEYDRIATMDYVSQIDNHTLIPYVLSIYDLDLISRILNTEHFIKYARERSKIAEKGQIHSVDELDFLGLYSKTGPGMYDNTILGKTLKGIEETEGLYFIGNIIGSDNRIRQLLTEFEYKYPTHWLTKNKLS